MQGAMERWSIQRKIRRAVRHVRTAEEIDKALAETAPLRAVLMNHRSMRLVGQALAHGIVIADIPLPHGNPLWREEAGIRYLSAEADQEIRKAVSTAREAKLLKWLPVAAAILAAIAAIVAAMR